MVRCELNVLDARFLWRPRKLKGFDQIVPHSLRQGEQDVTPILEAAVDCRCICLGDSRYGSHSECLLSSFLTKSKGCIQDALLDTWIRSTWHQHSYLL